jgi:hypothetical protein
MKKTKLLSIAALLIAIASITTAFKGIKVDDNKGFAVVELFTSEGCSSCPSADAVIEKLNKEITDKPIYILAYHVDYWDRGGWKDAFSSAEYSKRQNDYATWLKLKSLYTPQVVVNGKTEFVGSQEGTLRSVIQTDLKSSSKATLHLDHATLGTDKISVDYHSSEGRNVQLVTALVQPYAQVNVKRGENGGRILSHLQIVRQLQHQNLNQKDGSITIKIPDGADLKTWQLIGLLQDSNTGEILGATKIALS